MGGFFAGLADSISEGLNRKHQEGEQKKKELRDAYFKVWSDPSTSDAVRQDAWDNLQKQVNPEAKKGLAKIAPIFGKLAGHGQKQQADRQQGEQQPQAAAQTPPTPGQPSSGQQQLASPITGSSKIQPAIPPPVPTDGAADGAAAPTPGSRAMQPPPASVAPSQSGAQALQRPGMGQAYGADYGARQREQVQVAAEQAQQRQIGTFQKETDIGAASAKTQAEEKRKAAWEDTEKTSEHIHKILTNKELSPEEQHAQLAAMGVNMPHPSAADAVKNIPGSALAGQKDAFGNPTDPTGVYTRTPEGKLYPEAPPPKAPAAEKFTGALGEGVQAQNIIANPKSSPQEVKAAKAYLKNQELAQQAKVITINNASDQGSTVSDDDLRESAKYELDGGSAPNFGFGKSKMRERYLHIKADEMAKRGGGDSAAAQRAQFKADSASLGSLTKVRDTMKAAENGTVAEIDRLMKLSQSVPRSDMKLYNRADQFFSANLSAHPELARYREALLAARYRYNSMISSMRGGGAATNQVRSETAEEILDRTMSQGTLEAAANEMKVGIANVMAGVDQAVDETKKRLRGGVLTAPGNGTATGGPGAGQLGGPKTPIVQRSNKTGEYRYSLDGGTTWQQGQPPK